MMNVPRASITRSDGRKACARCGGPVDQVRRRFRDAGLPGVLYESWCRKCKTEHARERRKGKVQVLLTPEEWAAVKAARVAGGFRPEP